ncbi:unnamed protein product [Leuciscus chuanchicus]
MPPFSLASSEISQPEPGESRERDCPSLTTLSAGPASDRNVSRRKASAGAGSGLQLVGHDWDRAEIRLLGEEGSAVPDHPSTFPGTSCPGHWVRPAHLTLPAVHLGSFGLTPND